MLQIYVFASYECTQLHTYTITHSYTHTPRDTHAVFAPKRYRVYIIHVHVFGSSKCLQRYVHT